MVETALRQYIRYIQMIAFKKLKQAVYRKREFKRDIRVFEKKTALEAKLKTYH